MTSIFIASNIQFLRKERKVSQGDLAKAIDVQRTTITNYENGTSSPDLEKAARIAKFFNVTLDILTSTDLTSIKSIELEAHLQAHLQAQTKVQGVKDKISENQMGNLKVLAITVDEQQNEIIKLVPVYAHAGYLSGFQDPEYVSNLPTISISNILPPGSYRAFEVKGDSMEPTFYPGDRLICRYVESLDHINSQETYVVINEEIRAKRVINKLRTEGVIELHSDNSMYADYFQVLKPADIKEVWKVEGILRITIKALNTHEKRIVELEKELREIRKASRG